MPENRKNLYTSKKKFVYLEKFFQYYSKCSEKNC